jgi:hypothetical protein
MDAEKAAAAAVVVEVEAVEDLTGSLEDLQVQQERMKATSTTIGAGSMADAYDAIQRSREAMAATMIPDRYAGYGPSVPADMPVVTAAIQELTTPPDIQSTWDMILDKEQSAQVPMLELIAIGIDAIARKEGIVIEEVGV